MSDKCSRGQYRPKNSGSGSGIGCLITAGLAGLSLTFGGMLANASFGNRNTNEPKAAQVEPGSKSKAISNPKNN